MECLNKIVTILSLPLSILSIILSWYSIKLAKGSENRLIEINNEIQENLRQVKIQNRIIRNILRRQHEENLAAINNLDTRIAEDLQSLATEYISDEEVDSLF